MNALEIKNGIYQTPQRKISLFARIFPDLALYSRFLKTVIEAGSSAKHGHWSAQVWMKASIGCLRAMEYAGVQADISGIEHVQNMKEPCVIVGNHMSVAETVILPCLIRPFHEVTFIVKQSLLEYPVFKHIMRAIEPIAVTRDNPRHDLKHVLIEGSDRLARGISVVVFPQTARTHDFNTAHFSTLGVKLARKAGVPIIPLALDTSAWGNGRLMKDFGKIDVSKDVHFAFGPPITGEDRDDVKQQKIIHFIQEKLAAWHAPSPENSAEPGETDE